MYSCAILLFLLPFNVQLSGLMVLTLFAGLAVGGPTEVVYIPKNKNTQKKKGEGGGRDSFNGCARGLKKATVAVAVPSSLYVCLEQSYECVHMCVCV